MTAAQGHHRDDIEVRLAEPSEFPEVADLLVRAYTSSFHNTDQYIERLRGIASWVPDYQIWVAAERGKILGAVLTPSPASSPNPTSARTGRRSRRTPMSSNST